MRRHDSKSQLSPGRRVQQHNAWSNRLVRYATTAGVIATIVLVGGFVYGTYAALGGSAGAGPSQMPANTQPAGAPQPYTTANKMLHLAALGDSLTHGLGDASGRGYVGDVSQQYRQQGYSVIQSNLGIDGLTSGGLVNEVKKASVQNLLQSANVILISIGGNDLNDAAGLPDIHTQRIALAEQQFDSNLTTILSGIRRVNPSATIALVGLYNPYGGDGTTARQTNSIVQSWVVREQQIAATFPQTIVVQTFDLFQLHPAQFLYVDHFHPNQAGYQRIADRIWQDLQGP